MAQQCEKCGSPCWEDSRLCVTCQQKAIRFYGGTECQKLTIPNLEIQELIYLEFGFAVDLVEVNAVYWPEKIPVWIKFKVRHISYVAVRADGEWYLVIQEQRK